MSGRDPDAYGIALARFSELLGGDDPASPLHPATLDEAALAISAVLQPQLDSARWLTALDELADGCPAATREAIVAHLFGSGRLRGDRTTYADWRNSCIDQVIDRGVGIPITLAVVAIEVGRRLNVPLIGVGMPAHFLVGDARDPEWFVDAFNEGQILDRDGCRALFARIAGDDHRWDPSYLDPTPPRAIAIRMLNNLKAWFSHRGDRVRLALVMRMRVAMPELRNEEREAKRALAVFN